MLDSRTMGRIRLARQSARSEVDMALRRAGYDPATLEELPDPGTCDCHLAATIRRFQEAERELTAAEDRAPLRV